MTNPPQRRCQSRQSGRVGGRGARGWWPPWLRLSGDHQYRVRWRRDHQQLHGMPGGDTPSAGRLFYAPRCLHPGRAGCQAQAGPRPQTRPARRRGTGAERACGGRVPHASRRYLVGRPAANPAEETVYATLRELPRDLFGVHDRCGRSDGAAAAGTPHCRVRSLTILRRRLARPNCRRRLQQKLCSVWAKACSGTRRPARRSGPARSGSTSRRVRTSSRRSAFAVSTAFGQRPASHPHRDR